MNPAFNGGDETSVMWELYVSEKRTSSMHVEQDRERRVLVLDGGDDASDGYSSALHRYDPVSHGICGPCACVSYLFVAFEAATGLTFRHLRLLPVYERQRDNPVEFSSGFFECRRPLWRSGGGQCGDGCCELGVHGCSG